MRQSQLFTKTRKEAPSDEVSKNAILLTRAGYIHKEMAGVYTMLPLGLRVLKKIEDIVRHHMDTVASEVLMPSLSPEERWSATGRLETIDVLMKKQLVQAFNVVFVDHSKHIHSHREFKYLNSKFEHSNRCIYFNPNLPK